MIDDLLRLIVLFLVIFDPALSLGVFASATKKLKPFEARKIAFWAVSLAATISLVFLLFGERVLVIFNTNINDFRVAGGVVLALLGLNMVIGKSTQNLDTNETGTSRGIAAIIATPLLTGPAAITAIILSANQFGKLLTGSAVAIVLLSIGIIFFYAARLTKIINPTFIQVASTILGLVTLSWGVDFIRTGLGF